MAGWLRKFLDKLVKKNQQAFQGQRMDCCELNRVSNNRPVKQQAKKSD